MYCKKCGKEIPDNSRFCNYCGNEIFSDIKEDVKIVHSNNRVKIFKIIATIIFGVAGTVLFMIGTKGGARIGDFNDPMYVLDVLGLLSYLIVALIWIIFKSKNEKVTESKLKKEKNSEKQPLKSIRTDKKSETLDSDNSTCDVMSGNKKEDVLGGENEAEKDPHLVKEKSTIETLFSLFDNTSEIVPEKRKTLKEEFLDSREEFKKAFKNRCK